MTPSNLCFRAAMLLVLAGMIWGLHMAITDDHSAFPAHAHLNLLGFVALFLFGIFYRLIISDDGLVGAGRVSSAQDQQGNG